jgi:carboxyl-terminal processing protease
MARRLGRWQRSIMVGAAIIAIPLAFGALRRSGSADRNGATVLGQVFQIVTQRAIDSLPEDSLYIRAARGLVNSLDDPYASLYNRKESEDFMRNAIGNDYGGLGMGISQEDSVVVVGDVFPQSPAERGGVERGDMILGIDSARVVGWSTDKVSQHLTGKVGTQVTVTFGRADMPAPIRTTFTRAVVHAAAVPYTLLLSDHVGYIPLQRFNQSAGLEVAAAVKSLEARGADRFVVDLRGNGGGEVDQAVKVSSVFLRKGQAVVTQRERGVPPNTLATVDLPVAADAPLAVLVDGNTASASEIVAGALQDHDRGLIVGANTFGKGIFQAVYNLDGGFVLKLTTGKWYTPSGRSIHRDRKMIDGRFVVVDSDSVNAAPPLVMRSDAGRKLLSRGGITPDVTVPLDTLSSPVQAMLRASLPHLAAIRSAIFDVARGQHGKVTRDFVVTPALLNAVRQQMEQSGIKMADSTFDGGASYLDELLTEESLRLTFGDSSVTRHALTQDSTAQRAIELLRRARTQPDLYKEIAG